MLRPFKSDSHGLKFLLCVVLNISNKKSMPTKKSIPTVIMLCMTHTVLVMIFNWSCGWRVLDLLIQFYDPLLYRFLKSTQRDIARRAVQWIKSLFRAQLTNDDVTHSLWDIIFQSVDPLLPLWIRFVP